MVSRSGTFKDILISDTKVNQVSKTIIGIKQTVKALKSGIVQEVRVAKDAIDRMAGHIIEPAREKGILIEFADSRLKFGKVYDIHVDAAAMAFTGYQFLCRKHKDFVFTQKMNHLDMWY